MQIVFTNIFVSCFYLRIVFAYMCIVTQCALASCFISSTFLGYIDTGPTPGTKVTIRPWGKAIWGPGGCYEHAISSRVISDDVGCVIAVGGRGAWLLSFST